jgi:hypothetical protein
MNWTVVWLPAAEKELAALWLDPINRPQLSPAADKIDGLLRRDPLVLGESREGNQRIAFENPLAVLYRVKEPDRLVEVIHVWKFA